MLPTLLAAALVGMAAPASAAEQCEMDPSDRAWLAHALEQWPITRSEVLALAPAPMPEVTVYDRRCAYVSRNGMAADLVATPHKGGAIMIGGRTLPVGPYAAADSHNRFTMSLPSVWRHAGVSSRLGLERFMTGVFLHEVMHTAQSDLLSHARASFAKGLTGYHHLTDDTVQELFANDPAYVAQYRAERDLLYRAANAPSDAEARRFAAEALAAMDRRRARFFTGKQAHLARLDDTFLTMEGLGQLVMFRHLMAQPGAAGDQAAIVGEVRNGGAFWTQDAGFGLMLVVARLVPDWQQRVFDRERWQARKLLAAAAKGAA